MSAGVDQQNAASNCLQQVLDEAIDSGADAIELEWGDEGLEVLYVSGRTGIGTIITDSALASGLLGLIIDKAGLEDRSCGVISWTHHGKRYSITASQHESFGEWAYTLRLGKSARRRS